jgi:single-stranded-DNA-specific exonuclease
MIDRLENLVRECKKASEIIKFFPGDIRILSHYDADGITSAAIIARALQREGKGFHLTLIKQLNEEWVRKVAGEKSGLILFLDFGSGLLDAVSGHLKGKQVIILDHHQKQGSVVPEGDAGGKVLHINPMDFRIEDNISCSGVSYIVARAMNPENRELAELAIIGAIGDSQIGSIGPNWGVMGLNKEILKDAMLSKKIRLMKGLRLWGRYTRPVHKALEYSVEPYIPGISGSESASVQFLQELNIRLKDEAGDWRTLADLSEEEQKRLATGIIAERIRGNQENPEWIFGDVYELLAKEGGFRDANEFATMLNATGKMGKGHLGIALCLNDAGSQESVKLALERYRRTLGSAISWIQTNRDYVKETGRARYVLAGKNISEHIISNAISTINRSYDTGKPIFGFVDSEEGVKVSARASDELVERGMNLKAVLSEAAGRLGGQGGGHSGAAGATIPEGKEGEFISLVEGLLGGKTVSNINIADTNKTITPESNPGENHAERGQEGRGKGEKDRGENKEEGGGQGQEDGKEGGPGKEMEGEGLVRYIKS